MTTDTTRSPAAKPRWARAALWLVGALLVIIAAIALLLDTAIGHRFVIDRIAAAQPQNGLRIEIGRIDGSIYRQGSVRNVRLSDPQGRFAVINTARFDWAPCEFLWANRLRIDMLTVEWRRCIACRCYARPIPMRRFCLISTLPSPGSAPTG